MAIAKETFLWYKKGEIIRESDSEHIDEWSRKGHVVLEESEPVSKPKKPSKPVVEGDLNGDGKFDKKDKSIAGKILRRKTKK